MKAKCHARGRYELISANCPCNSRKSIIDQDINEDWMPVKTLLLRTSSVLRHNVEVVCILATASALTDRLMPFVDLVTVVNSSYILVHGQVSLSQIGGWLHINEIISNEIHVFHVTDAVQRGEFMTKFKSIQYSYTECPEINWQDLTNNIKEKVPINVDPKIFRFRNTRCLKYNLMNTFFSLFLHDLTN